MSFEPSTHVLKARWYTVIGAILLPLAAVAGIVALAIGKRGREDTVSWLTGRQPLESGRYCNNDGDCWDLERGDPVMVYLVTPGGARFGDGIRARMSEVRDWDFEIDHGRAGFSSLCCLRTAFTCARVRTARRASSTRTADASGP